jgi:hypothetical protein
MDESTEKCFIISVVENFVSSRVRASPNPTPEDVDKIIEETSNDFLEVIRLAANRLPESKFAVVMPLQRPALKWYEDCLSDLRSHIEEGILGMKLDNVAKIECISTITQEFDEDQVHLTKAAGKAFLNFIFGQSEAFFNSIQVNLTEDDEPAPAGAPSTSSLLKRLSDLEAAFRTRNMSDNMVLARLREEIDSTANKSKEDRIVVNGLVCRKPIPSEIKAKTALLTEVAMEIFKFLIPGFTGKITFISQGKGVAGALPMVEVRLDTVASASAIRKAFAEKSKTKKLTGDYERMFITNSVNLATRVRIDVMKTIARKLTNSDVQAYVVGFIARPVLHVKKRSNNTQRSYTFVDSVSFYGHLLRPVDLGIAYKRAGKAFDGQLQQNFIVLNEDDREVCWNESSLHREDVPTGSGSHGRGGGDRGARGGGGYRGVRGRDERRGQKRGPSPSGNSPKHNKSSKK